MVAGEPTVVPITRRVRGLRKNSSSMKGTLRRKFTTAPSTAFSVRMGRMPSRSVTTSTSPSGRPMT